MYVCPYYVYIPEFRSICLILEIKYCSEYPVECNFFKQKKKQFKEIAIFGVIFSHIKYSVMNILSKKNVELRRYPVPFQSGV